jgi:hypothetical protein
MSFLIIATCGIFSCTNEPDVEIITGGKSDKNVSAQQTKVEKDSIAVNRKDFQNSLP